MASNTRELFGDDSSSSDDDDEVEKENDNEKNETLTVMETDSPENIRNDQRNLPKDQTALGNFKDTENDNDDDEDEMDDDSNRNKVNETNAVASSHKPSKVAVTHDENEDEKDAKEEMENIDDEDDTAEAVPQTLLVVPEWGDSVAGKLSNNNNNIASPVQYFMTKLPNLVGIQTIPFHPEKYDPHEEENYFGAHSAHNLMRWRYAARNGPDEQDALGDGNRQKSRPRESNTRLIEWEDGSWTVHIGAEAFEVDMVDKSTPEGFAGLNGYLYVAQKATIQTITDPRVESESGDITSSTGTAAGTVLECVAPMNRRIILRPSSLQSEAHKLLTLAVRQQTITKRAKVATYMTVEDPEKLKEERMKVKMDLDKARGGPGTGDGIYPGGSRGNSRQRRSSRYSRSSYGRRRAGEDEDEDDGNFDTTNIRAMKRGIYDQDANDFDDYADQDEEEDDDQEDGTFRRARMKKAVKQKRSRFDDDDEDDDDDGDDDDNFHNRINSKDIAGDADDDDEEDIVPVMKKAANKKRATQSLFDDDDDDDSE